MLKNHYYLYTDGSSNYKNKVYGSGYAIVYNDNIIAEDSITGKYKEYTKHNNISGEILACLYGIQKCIELGIKTVIVRVDYIGLIHWREGKWNTNNDLSKKYVQAIRYYEQFIQVEFEHVKGHSNEKYNDYVDKLAKKSIEGVTQIG